MLAALVGCAGGVGSARREAAPAHRDAVRAPGACSNDAAACPGDCNAQRYCELAGEFGPEVRLPPAHYAVKYELRAHEGIMNKDPALLVLLEPLWVSKRESSVGDYRRCKDCAPKAFLDGQADDAPLELSFVDAQAFCKATGRRLATPEEWPRRPQEPSRNPSDRACPKDRVATPRTESQPIGSRPQDRVATHRLARAG